MNIRAAVFWARDFLFGGTVRAELRDVEFLNNRSGEATRRRTKLLNEHLAYAKSKVPYYQNRDAWSSLEDFPVLTKKEIRPLQSQMVALGFDPSTLHVASTSGSTGTPFRIYQDRRKRQRADAETIYLGKLGGYDFGKPLWFLRLWTGRNEYSRTAARVRNLRPIDVSKFRKEDAAELLREIDKRKNDIAIIALSSSLETIARFLKDNDNRISSGPRNISALIGQAEPLSQTAREILREHLGIYPVARYGMQEFGLLGQQHQSRSETYRLNLASHIVEVLKVGSNERAAEGELGRVVVTDLFNKAQPLIRYDTGDLAVVRSYEAGTEFAESLDRLEGRSRERLYDVDDEPLAPMISSNFWWKYRGILQYQIIQRGRGHYVLRLEVADEFEFEAELVEDLRNQVGTSARIDVEYSTQNYQHASGKRQVIVSEYVPPTAS